MAEFFDGNHRTQAQKMFFLGAKSNQRLILPFFSFVRFIFGIAGSLIRDFFVDVSAITVATICWYRDLPGTATNTETWINYHQLSFDWKTIFFLSFTSRKLRQWTEMNEQTRWDGFVFCWHRVGVAWEIAGVLLIDGMSHFSFLRKQNQEILENFLFTEVASTNYSESRVEPKLLFLFFLFLAFRLFSEFFQASLH